MALIWTQFQPGLQALSFNNKRNKVNWKKSIQKLGQKQYLATGKTFAFMVDF